MDFVGVISKDLFQKEVYYVMTLDDSKYKNIKDLDGKSIGIYSSKNGEEAIKLLDKKIKSTSKEYKNVVELFEDLQDNKIDAVLINESTKNLLDTDLADMELKLKEIYNNMASWFISKKLKCFGVELIHINGIDNCIGAQCALRMNIPYVWHY